MICYVDPRIRHREERNKAIFPIQILMAVYVSVYVFFLLPDLGWPLGLMLVPFVPWPVVLWHCGTGHEFIFAGFVLSCIWFVAVGHLTLLQGSWDLDSFMTHLGVGHDMGAP